ncbi:MAG: acyl-CoA reductase, partial [Myxococcota bacterium]|nr:acyl-CoA reductase [Myxococcota bacterium]
MKLLDLADLSSGPGRALLEATCAMGFSEPVARAGLEAELGAWRSPGAIAGVLRELPPDLDPRRRPREVLVIAARTLPVSAMRAVLMARLLGARVRLKSSSGQETLGEILQAVDPGIVATPFASDEEDALQAHLDEVDAVVVLGEDSTLDAVRAATPDGCAFIGYGHKVSAAWLDRTDQTTARALALDLCAWDQSGCLSPQVAWVSGEPETFLARLAEEIEAVESSLPM